MTERRNDSTQGKFGRPVSLFNCIGFESMNGYLKEYGQLKCVFIIGKSPLNIRQWPHKNSIIPYSVNLPLPVYSITNKKV